MQRVPDHENPLLATEPTAVDKILADRKPKMSFDIGACEGAWAWRLLSHDQAQGGIVHLFEPIPNMCESLRCKFKYDPRVIIHNLAIGDTEEILKAVRVYNCWSLLPEDKAKQVNASESVLFKNAPPFKVQVTTLDAFIGLPTQPPISRQVPDFVKVDVDGYEVRLLRGAKKALAHRPPIYFELWDGCQTLFGNPVKEMCQLIYQMGYHVWAIDGSYCCKDPETLEKLIPYGSSFDVLLLAEGEKP